MRARSLKKFSLLAILLGVFYIISSRRYHNYQIEVVIKNTNPKDVWEYVADFSKMRVLNPSILDFKITSDAGHAHDWRYSVVYREILSYWPYWLNTATANYIVTKTMPGITPKMYAIHSKHQTCFFGGFYCLLAQSDMKFVSIGEDTHCVETINYQCPPFITSACHRELEHQRKIVMHNLTELFSKK